MKKRYGIIAALAVLAVLLCLCMTGCNATISAGEKTHTEKTENDLLEVYGTGVTDGDIAIGGIETYSFWEKYQGAPFADENAPQTMTVTFNGETYSGTYKETFPCGRNCYLSHYYAGLDSQNRKVEFSVRAQTEELESFCIYPVNDLKISEEEAEKIALSVADQYIDCDEYVKTVFSKSDRYIEYEFRKYIDNIKTTEVLNISIAGEGEVYQIAMTNIGAFSSKKGGLSEDGQKKLSVLKSSDAETFVKEKAEKMCPGYTFTEIEDNRLLVPLENNEIGMIYTVWFEKSMSETESEATTVELLVK